MVKGDTLLIKRKATDTTQYNETPLYTSQSTHASPTKLRDIQYLQNYGSQSLIYNVPDIRKCLAHCPYDQDQRAIIVDLIAKILDKTIHDIYAAEFFKTIAIIDLYFKYRISNTEKVDIKLIGKAALFLILKYENKISSSKKLLKNLIKNDDSDRLPLLKLELDIFKSVGFNLKFSTIYDLYCSHHLKYFQNITEFNDIKNIGIKILFICVLDTHFNDICAIKLCLSVLRYAVQYYMKLKLRNDTKISKFHDPMPISFLMTISNKMVEDVGDEKYFENTIVKIKKHIRSYRNKFSQCDFITTRVKFEHDKL